MLRKDIMSDSNILIKQIMVGPMQNFAYFIGDKKSNQIAVVDPAWDINLICQEAEKSDLKITAILLTHGHYDHADGVCDLLERYDVPVYISQQEMPIYMPNCKNLKKIKDHEKVKIGNIDIECILTPGHTPGCLCFYVPGHLITGDTLFVHGCGRCDLPGGDAKKMHHSLYNIIGKLPEETIIYPGHFYGPSETATLKSQKETNPYLQSKDLEHFLSKRMGL